MSHPCLCVEWNDIVEAADRIDGIAHKTPVLTSTTLNERLGAQIFFKCENFQRMGAFKFRGAYNALSRFSDEQKHNGVITYSSGNHAQAIALSARLLGIPAVIVMPEDAPSLKINATKGYGAEVIFYDRYSVDREALCGSIAAQRRLTLIPPYNHPWVIAGQGTAAKELIEEVGELDLLVTPIGGGGLLSGSATSARHLCPHCAVWGVEPQAGNDVQQSFQSGRIVSIDVPRTIADGAQTQHAGSFTFPIIKALCDGIETVSDEQLIETMQFFAERMKIVVEPTGCLGAAAVLSGRLAVRNKRVGIILSGGNVAMDRFAEFLAAPRR